MYDLTNQNRNRWCLKKNAQVDKNACKIDKKISSNLNVHKSLSGLCFWAWDPLKGRFYWNLSIKGSEAQNQSPLELLWRLWFDKKYI